MYCLLNTEKTIFIILSQIKSQCQTTSVGNAKFSGMIKSKMQEKRYTTTTSYNNNNNNNNNNKYNTNNNNNDYNTITTKKIEK